MSRHLLTAVLLTAGASGCVTLKDDAWTLRFTREALDGGDNGWFEKIAEGLDPVYSGNSTADLILPGVLIVIAAAPLIVDLVCLPVTLPRDLVVGGI